MFIKCSVDCKSYTDLHYYSSWISSFRHQMFISFVCNLKLQRIWKDADIYLFLRARNGSEITQFSRSFWDEIYISFSAIGNEFLAWWWASSAFLKPCEGKIDYFQSRTVCQLCLASIWLYIFVRKTNKCSLTRQKAILGTSLCPLSTYGCVMQSGSKIVISAMAQVIKLTK